MRRLSILLKKQNREIQRIKECPIVELRGFGKEKIICILTYLLESTYAIEEERILIQRKIDNGFYKSLEDFDSYHSADIRFFGDNLGKSDLKFKTRTFANLKKLAEYWRSRINEEHNDINFYIVINERKGEYCLDTFNYKPNFQKAIFF
jgi:hypothetical protein